MYHLITFHYAEDAPRNIVLWRQRYLCRFICLLLLSAIWMLCCVNNAFAVTPMPSEIESSIMEKAYKVRQNDSDTACNIKISYAINEADGKPYGKVYVDVLYFPAGLRPYDVYRDMAELMKAQLSAEHIANVSLECGFCGESGAACR